MTLPSLNQTNMRIPHAAINGSGIGGLEPPPLLYKKNLVPNLHMHVLKKKTDNNAWIGRKYGLSLQPHAVKVLYEIGLMEEVTASGWAPMNQKYFYKEGQLIANYPK